MINFIHKIIILISLLFTLSCNERTSYSGKLLNSELNYNKIIYKNEIVNQLGNPSYIDPIENKYFYYTEESVFKNFFNKKIIKSRMIVFKFDEDDKIISKNEYNLNDKKDLKSIKDSTPNNLIKLGFIEKIFGGVGKNPFPTTSE